MNASTRTTRWASEEHLPESAATAVAEAIVPILKHAASGNVLPSVNALAPEERDIRLAISAATGIIVRRVELVSVGTLATRRELLVAETYAVTLAAAIERRLGFGLSVSLGSQRWNALRGKFGYDEPVGLADFLLAADTRIPRDNVRAATFAAAGFVLAGEPGLADRLVPLLRILASAIPLGEKVGESGTWIVIVP
jgi:hypothetical protein